MNEFELKHTDTEEVEDLLAKVEKSFGIEFSENELVNVLTFGELCDCVKNKIRLDKNDDCTNQQAFYKLRNALTTALCVDKDQISPETLLSDILPRQIRKAKIKELELILGFELSILRPPHFVTYTLTTVLSASLIGLFLSWRLGLGGIGLALCGFWIAMKIGNELNLKTVGELAQKMTQEHYLESRRNPNSFNENEIENVLADWFSRDLFIDKSKLTRDSRFN